MAGSALDFLSPTVSAECMPTDLLSHLASLNALSTSGQMLCAVDASPIEFYMAAEEHGWLSNFSLHPFDLHDRTWRTAEHFYQAQKFATMNRRLFLEIINARTPEEAEYIGKHSKASDIPNDWLSHARLPAMTVAVTSKFLAHADLRDRLLRTGDRPLIETSPGDPFWGIGSARDGQNNLGRLLMTCRLLLQNGDGETALKDFRQASSVALQLRLFGSPRCLPAK